MEVSVNVDKLGKTHGAKKQLRKKEMAITGEARKVGRMRLNRENSRS